MDVRRIQKTGTSTMTVSLPKEWTKDRDLRPGDPVRMSILPDGTLSVDATITRKEERKKKTIKVDADESKDHLERKLIGAYLAGFDIIEVRSKERMPLELKRAVKDFSRMVIGPEVIEETSEAVVLHDLSNPTELPQQKCVKRMHLITASMHSDAIIAFQTGDETLARDVIDRDSEVDRLYWMVAKQYNLILADRKLSEAIGVNAYDGMNMTLAARVLERIGDHAERIAENAVEVARSRVGDPQDGIIKRLSDSSLEVLEQAVSSLFSDEIGSANAAIDGGSVLVQNCEKARTKTQAVIKTTVLDSIARTTMYAMDIAEIAINRAMRSEDDGR